MEQPTKTETMLGGMHFTAAKVDGAMEEVTIRQLPIREFPRLLAALDDEPAMVEVLCGKEKGWSETLSPEAFEQIVVEGERINADFFCRWVKRRLARQEKLLPGITERAVQSAGMTSQTTLPKSPSPAA